MADAEWGPWVVCDGRGGPTSPVGTIVQVHMDKRMGPELIEPPDTGCHYAKWPGFFWRWKRVRIGWFKTELRRVCDDPDYAPIWRYRLMNPRSTAVALLAGIVAKPPGAWIRDATDSDNRLPKRVKA